MAKKLYVGNLPYSIDNDGLKELFSQAGTVEEAIVITYPDGDRRSKGFGFVTMSTDEEATAAIEKFNEHELDGRKLNVNEARPREERPRGNFDN